MAIRRNHPPCADTEQRPQSLKLQTQNPTHPLLVPHNLYPPPAAATIMAAPTRSSAFAAAAPLRRALPVQGPARGACARRNSGARRARAGARACAPVADSGGARAAGKARAAAVLTRELPWLLSSRSGGAGEDSGARELLRGGDGELFADGVEFEFPVSGAGRGRRILKMLLMSLPLQASVGMLHPVIKGVVVGSPSADCLDLNYSVRCSTLGNAATEVGDWGFGVGGAFGSFKEADLGPRVEIVNVRTRLRFNDEGRITKWVDTWNKSVPEVLDRLSNIADPPELHSNDMEENASQRGTSPAPSHSENSRAVTPLASRVQGNTHREGPLEAVDAIEASADSAFHPDDWLYEDEEEEKVASKSWRASDDDDGAAAGRRLADAIVPCGPPLATADARTAALRAVEYLRKDFPRESLPGGGGGLWANPMDTSRYTLFHSDAILETPAFVAEGTESLAILHAVARVGTNLRFTNARIVCTEARIEAPRVVVARYVMRARGIFAGGLVQKSSFVKLRLNTAGEVVHCELSVDEIKDDCLPMFSRTKRWLWLG